jgi:hypothetical protein
MLTFDEKEHIYRWNGVIVPGVTTIIGEWVKIVIGGERYHVNKFTGVVIPSRVMEEAGAKGTDLHKGSQLILQGGIDWNSLVPEYIGPLRQFEKFLSDFDIKPLYTELPFYHPKYGYAGTIDIIATYQKALAFIDIKTGESSTVGPQVAAYERGHCAQDRYIGRTTRYALWLPKDGSSYKFEQLTKENDFEFFKACLMQKGFLDNGV